MNLLISVISISCVSIFVSFFLNKISKINENSRAEKKFVVKSPFWLVYLGIAGVVVVIFAICLYIRGDNSEDPTDLIYFYIFIILAMLSSLICFLAPTPGIWETRVNGDDITMVRFWVFKRYGKFSEITRINVSRNTMTVYVDKKVMFKSATSNVGVGNFISRAKKAEIEITNITPKIDI